jgi:hypothetical protein
MTSDSVWAIGAITASQFEAFGFLVNWKCHPSKREKQRKKEKRKRE